MSSDKNILEVNLVERMAQFGSSGMLLTFNAEHFRNNKIKTFMFTGGIVFCLCDDYKGKVSIDGKEYILDRRSIAVLPENHIICFSVPITPKSISILAVTTDYILDMPSPIDTNIFSFSRYIPIMSVSESKYEDFRSYFRFLDKESRDTSKYQDQIIRSILYALILEISGEYEAQYDLHKGGEIRSDNLTDKFFHLLAVYYREERTVKFYADRLCITPKYLSTAIKNATGRPVLDWIHEAVLIDAKMLLISTNMTVMEVSEKLNFSSPSAFVQFFKKHTGTTPKKL